MSDNNSTTNVDGTNDDDDDDDSISANLPVKMTPKDNPVSKVKKDPRRRVEVVPDTLEWCRRASQLEHCPNLTGGSNCKEYTACTCLYYALRPKIDGEESPARLRMIAR
jgi:hypothetical protein